MLKTHRQPYGYKNLLAYQKADSLMGETQILISHFLRTRTLIALADQMIRSARSVKQNIIEGWMRNSTKEYYEFLGFSLGANAELEEDCDDILKGLYPELMGIKGIMGDKGIITLDEVESLPFYPLNPSLPTVVRLKLRAKELNFLLAKLQDSLEIKMRNERTLTAGDRLRLIEQEDKKEREFEKELREKYLNKRSG